MKKLFISLALCTCIMFTVTAQVERKLPVKETPQLFAISSNAP